MPAQRGHREHAAVSEKNIEKIMKYQWDDVVFVASCKRPERKEAGSRDGGC